MAERANNRKMRKDGRLQPWKEKISIVLELLKGGKCGTLRTRVIKGKKKMSSVMSPG